MAGGRLSAWSTHQDETPASRSATTSLAYSKHFPFPFTPADQLPSVLAEVDPLMGISSLFTSCAAPAAAVSPTNNEPPAADTHAHVGSPHLRACDKEPECLESRPVAYWERCWLQPHYRTRPVSPSRYLRRYRTHPAQPGQDAIAPLARQKAKASFVFTSPTTISCTCKAQLASSTYPPGPQITCSSLH